MDRGYSAPLSDQRISLMRLQTGLNEQQERPSATRSGDSFLGRTLTETARYRAKKLGVRERPLEDRKQQLFDAVKHGNVVRIQEVLDLGETFACPSTCGAPALTVCTLTMLL